MSSLKFEQPISRPGWETGVAASIQVGSKAEPRSIQNIQAPSSPDDVSIVGMTLKQLEKRGGTS